MSVLPRPRVVWPALIGAVALLDWWCDRGEPNGDTLSELLREWWRVETPLGRAAFTASLALGANALHSHICKAAAA